MQLKSRLMDDGAPAPKRNWLADHPFLVIGALLALCLAPFLNRAVAVDDPIFLWTAERIQDHPIDFYGFRVNWYGVETQMAQVNFNPPTTSYLLSLAGLVFGWEEILLHGVFLLVAFAAAAGIHSLAAAWCQQPLLATVIAVLTPAFLVSSTTLMSDVLMCAFWVWAVVHWERGLQSSRWSHFLVAGLLAGFAGLTKYSAFVFLPVLLLLGTLRTRRFGAWVIGLIIPVGMLIAYEIITAAIYERGLFSQAREFTEARRTVFEGGQPSRWIIGLTFMGGGLLSVSLFAPLLWRRRPLLLATALSGGLLLLFLATRGQLGALLIADGKPPWIYLVQIALLAAAGLHVLALAIVECWRRRDATAAGLALWLIGGFLFLTVLNWTINARSLMPIVPAAAILVVRRLDHARPETTGSWRLNWPIFPAALIAIGVTTVDYLFANTARTAATQIASQFSAADGKLWFQGHWGFQYYMERLGAKAVDFDRATFQPGDILIVPRSNSNLALPGADSVELLRLLELPVCTWLSTMQPGFSGFHAASWGPLPFAFGPAKPEEYYVLKVVQPFRFQIPDSAPRPKARTSPEVRPGTNPVQLLLGQAMQFEQAGKFKEAIRTYREALALMPENPVTLNNLAWILASHPDSELRNGPEAVQLAVKAVELTGREQPTILGTLAAAYAEAGQFKNAVETAEAAMAMAEKLGQTQVVEANMRLLKLYREGKPARP